MLIEEIIPQTLAFVRSNPLSPDIPHFVKIIIDEYQDLNRAEQELFRALSRDGEVTAVGNEDQSIYSFKHAHPAGMSGFAELYPAVQEDTLIECRRCPTNVIFAANALIARNATRQNRVLVPLENAQPGTIHVVQWPSMEAEADGVATFIKRQIDAEIVKKGEVLVLSPRKNFGNAVRDLLVARGVETKSFFPQKELDGNPKLDGKHGAQEAFTLLTLLANPNDSVALRAWCGFRDPGLAARGWRALRNHCDQANIPTRVALEQLHAGDLVLDRSNHLQARFGLLREREHELRGLKGQELLDQLFPADAEWSEMIRELTVEPIESDVEIGASGLLEELRRLITQPEVPVNVDFVRGMSLHKSKGLTAKLVIVLGCMQGLLPGTYDPGDPDQTEAEFMEEQRRLFFVALTRTTDTLVLSSVVAVPRGQAHRMRVQPVRRRGGRENAVTHASEFINQLGPTAPAALPGATWLANN
ncbi:MAG: ATP-dependent helicase [Chloroflexota bacterium]